MRVVVAGGDGFCGLPTALHLSAAGHEVVVLDNLVRRRWDQGLGTASLTQIACPEQQICARCERVGLAIAFARVEFTNVAAVREVVARWEPEAIVHFAEQSSAPYSMIGAAHAAATRVNDVVGTLGLRGGAPLACRAPSTRVRRDRQEDRPPSTAVSRIPAAPSGAKSG